MDQETLQELARQSAWTGLAVDDSAAALASVNIQLGLAKMLATQQALGLPLDVSFVASPDLTIPRNRHKWQWGMAIGGKLQWGDGTQPLVFLDPQINTSTALVATIDQLPTLATLLDRIDHLRTQRIAIDGIEMEWDLGRDNHFLNLYQVVSATEDLGAEWVVIVHGGEGEVKRPNALGWGLDVEQSAPLRERMHTIATPWGPTRVLTDEVAAEYYAGFLRYKAYSQQKRRVIAEELFPGCRVISNELHHGYQNINTAVIGAYGFDEDHATIHPITLRADVPTYLVRGRPNIRPDLIPDEVSPTLRQRIAGANLLPHGGGYTFPETTGLVEVLQRAGERYVVFGTPDDGRRVTADLTSIPFAYRGEVVMERVRKWDLASVVATLRPVHSITT
jgi:hypothetical protein